MEINRLTVIRDQIYREGSLKAHSVTTRVAACAVIANPLAGSASDDVSSRFSFGSILGELLVQEALAQLGKPAIYYGDCW